MGSDLRYALRTLVKNPGFAAVAIVSLALGIGANTAIFTVVDSVLLRMLPVRSPQELYVVGSPRDGGRYTSWNYPDFAAFREHNTAFNGMTAYSGATPYGLALQDEPSDRPASVAYGLMVSGNYFDVLGVRPAVGRLLTPEDDMKPGAGPYAVLSYGFWQRRFAADAGVIGRVARVNGYPLTIVGVAAKGFKGADVAVAPDFFFPIWMRSEVTRWRNWNNRNNWWLTVLGRMKPGASIVQAEAELYTIGKSQEAENRRTAVNQRFVNPAQQVKLLPGAQGYSGVRNRLTTPLRVLMIVVGLVLLIACANVANLLLARAAARRREIAVRLAIGAGRWRLIRQLLTESILLAVSGGAAGIAFSYAAVPVLIDWIPRSGWTPTGIAATPDLRVLGFTLAVSLAAGLVFGVAPALQSARADVVKTLKDDAAAAAAGGSRFNLRKGLVVVQVALSLLLLIGAGLFVRSLRNLHDLDAGFRREKLLVVGVDPLRSGYSVVDARSFYERLRERLEGLPGVRSAVLASITPLGGSRWNDVVTVEGYQWKPEERRRATDMNSVGPRFFETVGIPLVAGRDFRPEDSPVETPEPDNPLARRPGEERPLTGPRVVVVNEALVKRFFAGRSPLGARISLGETFRMERSFEIIGVVKDAHYFGLREAKEPMMYQAMWRPGVRSQSLVVRTVKDSQALVEAIRREVHALDATIPLLAARTIEQEIDNNVLQEKIVATLSSFFGLLALVLASVGLYGVMAQSVAGRTREIGIRMALGAQAGSVLWLVLRDALLMVAIGAVVGVPAAYALSRLTGSMLYGITPADPASFALATGVLVAVAAVAGFLPARRATRIDPIAALRYE